jgi:hypothetical protein
MLVQVELLLVVLAVSLALLGVMVTVGIPPLLEAVVLPLLHAQEPPIVVITITGKQQCKMPLPITIPLILVLLLMLMAIFAPPDGMYQRETPVVNLPPLTPLMVALVPVVLVMTLMLVVNFGNPVVTLKVCTLAPVAMMAVCSIRAATATGGRVRCTCCRRADTT